MAVHTLLEPSSGPPFLYPADRESHRFGLTTGRADLGPMPGGTGALIDEITQSNFDLLVIRYPASETNLFARLMSTRFHVIHADSLLYAEKPLAQADHVELEGFDRRSATTTDTDLVDELVGVVFENYRSHYSANPLLDPDLVRAGYVEWANSFVGGSDRELVLLSEPGGVEVRAFSAVDLSAPGEVVLVGVHPTARGEGWHGRASAAAEDLLRRRGRTSAWTSTQVHNIAVQRTWRARGYVPRLALQTVHLVSPDRWDPTDPLLSPTA
jgi:ribosomal protein S18 acetylase RimI-like enzyme